MIRQVLLIHGAGEGAYRCDARLAESLRAGLGPGYRVRYPAMPDEDDAVYATWKEVILREVAGMGHQALLVGHSVGGSVLARIFTERGPKPAIGGLFLVASPFWHEHEFWHWEEARLPEDASDHFPGNVPLFLYHGESDEFVPVAHLGMYARALPRGTVRRLPGRNHQINDDMTEIVRDIEALA